jgi:uncharacterized protein (TIGR02145 family)
MYIYCQNNYPREMNLICRISILALAPILTCSCNKGNDNSVKDIDGNVYTVVKIGSQEWLAGNLKTTKYNNGDPIETTSPLWADIGTETQPEYQWAYDGLENKVDSFGRLYTWYAATDNRNICPVGWHVPADSEWSTLTDYLISNGYGYDGGGTNILKSMASEAGWDTCQIAGSIGCEPMMNNSSGFSALPGGIRTINGTFYSMGSAAWWWTSTPYSISTAWYRSLNNYTTVVKRDNNHSAFALSVRCIRDSV